MKKIQLILLLIGIAILSGACGRQAAGAGTEESGEPTGTPTGVEGSETQEVTFQQIAGDWKLDPEKTNAELKTYGSLQEMFGTGLSMGNALKIDEQGKISFYIGIGIGGEGDCEITEETFTARVTPYEDHGDSENEFSLRLEAENEKQYLIMEYMDEELYWSK